MVTRDFILKYVPDFPREEVTVPEWGGSIFVRTLTAADRDKLELEWEATQRKNFKARLVVYTACDETGKALFLPQDLPIVGNQSAALIQRIFDVALKLNRFTKEDVSELEKNSDSGPSGD